MLRIGATLDLGAVLQEVVDSARTLTSARYGMITTITEAGDVANFVTSGFTPEETRRFAESPDGPELIWRFVFGNGAQERTRTSTTFRSLAPEASVSTNFTTWASGAC